MKNVLWCAGQKIYLDNIVRGKGCYIYDSKGNKYLDFESGVWCVSLGHNHPEVVNIMKEQLDNIIHSGLSYSSKIIEQASNKILNITDFYLGACNFLCSGSEAVEYSIRVFKNVSDKKLILTMKDSYNGAYGLISEKRFNEWIYFDWLDCNDKDCFNNCDLNCSKFKEIDFNEIGGFLFEPGSSSGLVRFPSISLIDNIVCKIKENFGYLIINEVTTGIGRTGEWFGYQHYKIKPDIIALGKGIGNGYPVSACVVNERVLNKLENNEVKYSQSHQNDPLGATVAKKVLEIMKEENIVENSRVMGNYLFERLKLIKDKYSLIKEIRNRGLMIVIELKSDVGEKIQKDMLDYFIIISHRMNTNCLRLDPPLIVSKNEIDSFVNLFEKVIKKYI